MAEVERLQQLCPHCTLRPFGLGGQVSLERSGKRIRSQIKKLAVLSGAGQEAGEKLAECAVQISGRKRPRENQSLEPIQNGDGVPDISNQTECVGDVLATVQDVDPESLSKKPQAYKRLANDSPTLQQLVEVVEFALSLPDDAAKQKLTRAHFPTVLRSNILSKWICRYFKYQVWKIPADARDKMRAVPNWHIQMLGLNLPKRARSTICGVPKPVAELVNKAMLQDVQGVTEATKRADPAQGPHRLARTLNYAVEEYNTAIAAECVQIQETNERAWNDFEKACIPCEGERKLSKKGVAKKLKELKWRVRKCPKKIVFKPNYNTFKRFNKAMGNVTRSTNTQGSYLAKDDPRMILARQETRRTVEEHQILPGLVLSLGFSLASCFGFLLYNQVLIIENLPFVP